MALIFYFYLIKDASSLIFASKPEKNNTENLINESGKIIGEQNLILRYKINEIFTK